MMHELFEGLFTEDDKDFLDWVLKSLQCRINDTAKWENF
jgi:hypothetical protein